MNFALLSLHIWMSPTLSGTGVPGARLTIRVTPSVYLKFRIHDPALDIATCSQARVYPTILAWSEKDF